MKKFNTENRCLLKMLGFCILVFFSLINGTISNVKGQHQKQKKNTVGKITSILKQYNIFCPS